MHLEVETLADALVAADEVLGGDEPLIERDLIGVHAAVADRVDGAAFDGPTAVLGEREAVAVAAGFGHDEQTQAAICLAAVRVCSRHQRQDVGSRRESAPGFHASDGIAAVDPVRDGRYCAGVGAVVGLGHRDCNHHLTRGDFGQPRLFLRFGTALHERTGEDLGPRDQRTGNTERSPRQLLCRDNHAQVFGLPTRGEPAVLLRNGQPEGPKLGETVNDLVRDVSVRAVHLLRDGSHAVFGKAPERVLYQLEVTVEMARAGLVGQLP